MPLLLPQEEMSRHLANAHAAVARALERLESFDNRFDGEPPPGRKRLVWVLGCLETAATWRFSRLGRAIVALVSSVVLTVVTWGVASLLVVVGGASSGWVVVITLVAVLVLFLTLAGFDEARMRIVGRWRLRHTPVDVRLRSSGSGGWASTSRNVMSLCHKALDHIDQAVEAHLRTHVFQGATRTAAGWSWLVRVEVTSHCIDTAQRQTAMAVLELVQAAREGGDT